ncbi:MAG TPA: hypothetical protein VNZ06_09955 [Steroidobacteraceae bacterium]|jgi:hypothetical protein|nr:hypothetical protein [Steroidobacteraceae bacterium]
MMTRTFKMAAIAAVIAAVPTIGAATDRPRALNGCVKAFMAELSTKMPNTLKLLNTRYLDEAGASNLAALASNSELELTARDAHDNRAVARVICTVNSQGEVLDLRAASLGYEPF